MAAAPLKTLALLCCLAAVAFAVPTVPVTAAAPTEAPKVVPETTVAPAVPVAQVTEFAKVAQPVAAQATVAPTVSEAATTAAAVSTKEQVRLCTCDEVKACNEESKAKVDECKKGCEEYLEVFGNDTEGYKSCFKDIHDETVRVTDCFKMHAEGFCQKDAKKNATIDKPDYSSYTAVVELNETATDSEFNFDYAKKARKFYVNIRKYQNCAVSCVKKEAVKCYEKKACAVSIPEEKDQKDLYSGVCAMVEPMMRTHTSLTCTCLAFQKKVKDMQTSCGLTASSYLMRKL